MKAVQEVLTYLGIEGRTLASFCFVILEVNLAFQVVKLSPKYKYKVSNEDKDFYGRLWCLGLGLFFMALHEYDKLNPAVLGLALLAGLAATGIYALASSYLRKKHPDLFVHLSGKTSKTTIDGVPAILKYGADGELEAIKKQGDKTQFIRRPPAAE